MSDCVVKHFLHRFNFNLHNYMTQLMELIGVFMTLDSLLRPQTAVQAVKEITSRLFPAISTG